MRFGLVAVCGLSVGLMVAGTAMAAGPKYTYPIKTSSGADGG